METAMRSLPHPYQRALELKVIVREPTTEDLRAAYQVCVRDKQNLPFERALQHPALVLIFKNAAKAAITRRGGK
jgi:hypothetical protein